MKIKRNSILKVAGFFSCWRVIQIILAAVFFGRLSFSSFLPSWRFFLVDIWTRFDGQHYLNIGRSGYNENLTVFFPSYPLLIKPSAFFLGDLALSAVTISFIFAVLAGIYFYKLIRLDFNEETAWRGIIILLFFPASFFLFSAYGESLFLFLILAGFYYGRRKIWPVAFIFCALAAVTKVSGIIVWLAILADYWHWGETSLVKRAKIAIKDGIWLPFLFLGGWLAFLQIKFGDFLIFAKTQSLWTAGRRFSLPTETLGKYLNPGLAVSDYLDGLFFVFGLILLVISFRRIRFSYWLFWALYLAVPVFSSTLVSFPRFLLVCFPLFIYLAVKTEEKILLFLLLFGFSGLSFLFLMLFTNGLWVA